MRTTPIMFIVFALTLFNCSEKDASYADKLNAEIINEHQMFVIERQIPNAGSLTDEELKAISLSSCDIIDQIGKDKLSWLHSYVTANKVYCVYTARDENYIRQHAEKGGFPANSIATVATVIGPLSSE